MRLFIMLLFVLSNLACSSDVSRMQTEESIDAHFKSIMYELAGAWNLGDAEKAAGLFDEFAVYSEPPDKQLYEGRKALYDFFGGNTGRPGQMSMVWHHLAFNPKTEVGFGEFSFTYGSTVRTVHGVAVVRIQGGLITNWREYWYESELEWNEFIKHNTF